MNNSLEVNTNETTLSEERILTRLVQLARDIAGVDFGFIVNQIGEPIAMYGATKDLTSLNDLKQLALALTKNQVEFETTNLPNEKELNSYFTGSQNQERNYFKSLKIVDNIGKYKGLLCLAGNRTTQLTVTQNESLRIVTEQIVRIIDEKSKSTSSGIKRLLEKKFARLSYYYKAFLNSTNYGVILMDKKGIITVFNAGAEKMLGWHSEEIINIKNIYLFHDPSELETTFKLTNQAQPNFEDYVDKPTQGLTNVGVWSFIKKNLEKITVQLSVSAIKNEQKEIIGYLAVADDITEKRRTQLELQLSEEKHRFFFESTQGLMCSHDNDGKLLTINPAGAAMLGYKPEELIGIEIKKLVPELLKTHLNDYFTAITNKGFATGLVKLYHKDGSVRVLFYKNVRIGFGDKPYVIGNAFDVSARIEMENDLKKAKVFAEKANLAKDQFLANMSHEIRTPMNAIIGFADILADTSLNENQEECVSAIRSAGENLLGIINDILDYSKIQSGKLTIENVPFNLIETLQNTCNILKLKAVQKNIGLHLLVDQNITQFVIGDRLRINQILMNLIGNAIKFTETGEVTVALKLINENANTLAIYFSVKDTGIGIPHEKLTSIFDRFTQASNETTRKYGGTGLGLSISRNLIEILGGKLNVISAENSGSEFTFNLEFPKGNSVQSSNTAKVVKSNSLIRHVKVLLMEDNDLNQKLARKVLEGFGFEVDIAENGLLGIKLLQKKKYDVILMDLQMPVMDGYQATIEIRKSINFLIPIIAMTAHSLAGEKEKCLKIGMNDYIAKPFKAEDLFYKINLHTTSQVSSNDTVTLKQDQSFYGKVSLNRLIELSGGDKVFVKEIINVLLVNTPKEIKLMNEAIHNKDEILVKQIGHKLKSSMLVFDMNEIATLLNELEYKEMGINSLSTLWQKIEKHLNEMLTEMTEILIKNY